MKIPLEKMSLAEIAARTAAGQKVAKPFILDDDVAAVERVLKSFDRPAQDRSRVRVTRKHWSSLHVTVQSPKFEGLSRAERGDLVWPLLQTLDDEVYTQLAQVSLVAPGEPHVAHSSEEDRDLGHVYHSTSGPHEVWAACPSAPENRHYAAFTFDSIPTAERLRFVTEEGGERVTFRDLPEAALAAFRSAEEVVAEEAKPTVAAQSAA
ncbi:hypothetical protein [Alienimonas californiensis]|uniref:Uncharacterized protein n=1 Tax=Alienimonas californiensis TaxID=2527989 RepID=A0A517P3Q0_9PLAN|nr:hypothetical protein [Alienimonas californiensis]QDT13998.1 hypothetical protein CA12_00660 [Alienimonas californiensis]